jgi:hypothetical protein
LVGDVLTKMVAKASQQSLVEGLLGDFRPGGILTLQYADDTLLFPSSDNTHLRNLKYVLILFEKSLRYENQLPQE